MMSKIPRLLIAISIVLAASAVALSQEHEVKKDNVLSVTLGDRVIAIPPPSGFEEASSQFENIKERFKASEPQENDLLAAYLPATVCESLRRGQNVMLTYYAKVSVLRQGRDMVLSDSDFAATVSYVRANMERLMAPNAPKIKEVLQQLDQVYSKEQSKETKVHLIEPKSLGSFDNRPNVYSAMMFMTVKIDSGGTQSTVPMLAGISFLKVKEKILFVFTYRKYESQADHETLKTFTTNWNNSILAAN